MIKAEEIINKQFSRAFWGYDIGEVDEFLDDIVRSNERAEQELEIAQLRIKMLLEELQHYTGKQEDAKTEPEAAENAETENTEAASAETVAEKTGETSAEETVDALEQQEKSEDAEEEETDMEEITIRYVKPEDAERVTMVEGTCFPPAEAASRERIEARIQAFPKNFWVAEADGCVVGFINGMACERRTIVDEMFENAGMHDDAGAWQSVMSIAVLPEYQRHGIAARLMNTLIDDAKAAGRKGCTLTCKDRLIHYYAKFGYKDEGVSASEHGGAVWYDMVLEFPTC